MEENNINKANNTCQVKTGMFVVKECGEFAAVQCGQCGKWVCGKHGRQQDGNLICMECSAQNANKNGQNNNQSNYKKWQGGKNSSLYYSSWYYNTRLRFYNHSRYRPFDERDYESFENESIEDFSDDAVAGSFFDS